MIFSIKETIFSFWTESELTPNPTQINKWLNLANSLYNILIAQVFKPLTSESWIPWLAFTDNQLLLGGALAPTWVWERCTDL